MCLKGSLTVNNKKKEIQENIVLCLKSVTFAASFFV
jgi:hypothetical protein